MIAIVSKEAGTSKVYTNGSIRPTNLTSMAMTGLTPGQISNSFNLQQTYSEQEKYKRIGEMMLDEEKRVATMINTASGRNALRGFDNDLDLWKLWLVDNAREGARKKYLAILRRFVERTSRMKLKAGEDAVLYEFSMAKVCLHKLQVQEV